MLRKAAGTQPQHTPDSRLRPAGKREPAKFERGRSLPEKKDKWGETGLIYFPRKASLRYIILSFLLLGWETPVRKWQMVGNNKRKEMSSFKKEILHFLSLVVSAAGNVTELCNSLVSFWAYNVKREIIASVAEFQMSLVFKKEEEKIAYIKKFIPEI